MKGQEKPLLVILIGPTGIGKSDLAIRLALRLNIGVISADSRQIYRELPIGTAAPTDEDCARCQHFFIGTKSICEPYSASQYEQDALRLLDELYHKQSVALVTGGSMMYIDALCDGIDDMPDVKPEIRKAVYQRWEEEGLSNILEELWVLDPIYYERVDHQNYKRVLHGYEVCLSAGKPFSSFHTRTVKERPFRALKVGLKMPREMLYERINQRVVKMMDLGLLEEARKVYPYRNLNALNTVGYKELFAYFDGQLSLDDAITKIQKNSRVYARKQETWWKKQTDIHWFSPADETDILDLIGGNLR